ncbi:L-cystine-binding protein TcyK precursor [compost metagenome]
MTQYEFEYQTVSDQFVALTSKKVDLITSQWEKNPEREEAYLFGNHLVTTWAAHIAFKEGRTDIQTLEDLEGKTIQASQGTNDAFLIESYNKKNNNAINIEYGAGDITVFLKKIENGATDAFISTRRTIELIEENYNVALGISDKPVYNSNTYFVYRKNDADATKLQEAVDGALKTLSDQGTLKELSIKWLGEDYTKEAKID